MDEAMTKDFLKNMTRAALAQRLKKHIFGNLTAESFKSNLVEESIKRLEKNVAKCVTEESCEENLKWAAQSYYRAIRGKQVPCRGCKQKFLLVKLFRCYHCGSYFCPKCAREHFGARAQEQIKGAA